MKKLFPRMYNKPSIRVIIPLFAFAFMSFAYIPSALPLLTRDLYNGRSVELWLEFSYHLLNFLVFGALIIPSVKKDIQEIRLKNKKTGKTILITIGLMAATVLICALLLKVFHAENLRIYDVFPMAEFSVFYSATELIGMNPVIGIVCAGIFAPAAISAVCCGAVFAPAAVKRSWLGYAAITVFLALMLLYYIFYWKDYSGLSAADIVIGFSMRLPIYLLACWSCQKTDGIIAPVISITAINLIASLSAVFPV